MITQGITAGTSILANLFSALCNRVSRDALLNILISVKCICKISALTKDVLYTPVSAY